MRRALAIGVAGGILVWAAVGLQWWALTLVIGIAAGILGVRRREAIVSGALAGAIGWAMPLLAMALTGAPVGRAAAVISGVIVAPAAGIPALAITLLGGALLGAAGAWLGWVAGSVREAW